MQIRPERAERIITACCVLYNLAMQYGEREQDHEERDVAVQQDENEEVARQQVVRDVAGIAVRATIVGTFAA